MFTKSLLSGIDSATGKSRFADALDIDTLPFTEAVEYLKKRDVITKTDYYALADKLKFRAFTVSRIADGDLLKKINNALVTNTEEGGTLSDFLKLTNDDLLDKVGIGPGAGAYWENVYRTNVQTAYNTGRAIGFEEVPPLALELVVIDDSRTSPFCRPYAGKNIILPYDDPFWQTHWPPLHFQCRTTVRGIYDEDELPDTYVRPDDAGAADGFGGYPLKDDNWWKELSSQIQRAAEYGIQPEITKAAELLQLAIDDTLNTVTTAGGSEIITGASSGGILDKDDAEQTRFADSYYEEIRNRKTRSDVSRIAENTGFTKKQIQLIRNHLFLQEHDFEDGSRHRFDAGAQEALAWQRLENGTFTDNDILLLHHELEELTVMKQEKYHIYELAHKKANEKYPWEYSIRGLTNENVQKN